MPQAMFSPRPKGSSRAGGITILLNPPLRAHLLDSALGRVLTKVYFRDTRPGWRIAQWDKRKWLFLRSPVRFSS